MKYWKEIRNQRSVWLFAGGFVLLLGVMTGMLCTLGRRGIIPILRYHGSSAGDGHQLYSGTAV